MSKGLKRALRLQEMERLYLQRAFSDAEMAARLGVDRTVIFRDRKELEEVNHIVFIEEGSGRYRIDRRQYLSNVRLTIHEALSLYLAARRASQQTRMGQRPMANALEKIAQAMRQPMTENLVKSAEAIWAEQMRQEREAVFEAVANAWVEGRRLRVLYQGLTARKPYWDRMSPYLIEPSPWSDSVYVIGPSDVLGEMVTYRMDRILKAVVSTESYQIPEDFDEGAMLRYAWGVWRGDGEPQEVVLRFAAGPAARRVLESRWHPLEEVTALADGGVVWRAPIAEWREMLPWIRGWGADVEMLAPEALKQRLQSETQRLAAIYLTKNAPPSWFWLWAKADTQSGRWHPLIYHLIDVGVTAKIMWETALSEGEREQFAGLFNLTTEEAGNLFAFFVATHDLGKAGPGFQDKVPFARPILQNQGYDFPSTRGLHVAAHGVVTAWALPDLLEKHLEMPYLDAVHVAHAVGGHHGVWPKDSDMRGLHDYDRGGPLWNQARDALLQALLELFNPPRPVRLPRNRIEKNSLLMFLSGFTTAADWIGSMDVYFQYESRFMTLARYAEMVAQTAQQALEETGWLGWNSAGETPDFAEVFHFSPNAMQQRLFDVAMGAPLPALVILEAPTGGGKTEAALYLADVWLQRSRGKGMYIAMPTQATSNQMFGRTARFLQNRYPHVPVQLHLAHGNAAWTDQIKMVRPLQVGESAEDGLVANAWFLPRKRTLLAPFGVGTVDQSLMSVLQTRHFFLRLFGLEHKVVIFDEVHAYDTYMSELFLRLLRWLRAMGASVIILSATLPERTRRTMIASWLGKPDIHLADGDYPRFTLAAGAEARAFSIPQPPSRTIQMAWLDDDSEALTSTLAEQLKEGGCAAVICNTVKRAQELYGVLKQARLVDDDNLILFHARTPFVWRKGIEGRILKAFGTPGADGSSPHRPHKAIVVATQVIEQSLDLDFDLMITELAPIDLIIQRLGRLHRHQRSYRPAPLAVPRAFILRPRGEPAHPDFGLSQHVYAEYLLWQTWLTLQERSQLTIPDDTLSLIDAVYGDFQPQDLPAEVRDALEQVHDAMIQAFTADRHQARQRLVPGPEDKYLVTRPRDVLGEDDDPNVHEQLRAVTRLIGPTLNLVCLHRTRQGVFLEPDGSGPRIDLDAEPPRSLVKALVQRTITVQHPGVIYRLKDELPHPAWKRVAALRYSLPIVFENGHYTLPDGSYTLTLDRKYGLRIFKEDK